MIGGWGGEGGGPLTGPLTGPFTALSGALLAALLGALLGAPGSTWATLGSHLPSTISGGRRETYNHGNLYFPGPRADLARTHARNANTNTKHDFPVGAAGALTPQPPIGAWAHDPGKFGITTLAQI